MRPAGWVAFLPRRVVGPLLLAVGATRADVLRKARRAYGRPAPGRAYLAVPASSRLLIALEREERVSWTVVDGEADLEAGFL